MVESWLVEAMRSYNAESYSMRHAYAAQLHLPGPIFRELVVWALQSLPDEILVGLDVDADRKHIEEVESMFEGQEHVSNLYDVASRLVYGKGNQSYDGRISENKTPVDEKSVLLTSYQELSGLAPRRPKTSQPDCSQSSVPRPQP